ncbi:hypothetical protein JW935_11905 [candidate division KSB1 bacterium]|nr:hypothetical protein [candidate division KSB1 bacterium]
MTDYDLLFGLFSSLKKEFFSYNDLYYLTRPFNVTENSLRSTLARMMVKGVLNRKKSGRKSYYSVSEKGQTISENVARSFATTDWRDWDGQWWGVVFSVPNAKSSHRYRIQKKLIAFRFASLQPRFWIRPKNPLEFMDQRLASLFQQGKCRLLTMQFFHGLEHAEINRLWKLSAVNRSFAAGLLLLKKNMKKLTKMSPRQAFKKKYTVGARIVPILFKDPLLPEDYLPTDWKGKELKAAFREWDKQVTRLSRPFWEKIMNREEGST